MSHKAFVYRTDGSTELVEFEKSGSLAMLQQAVGGYVECIRLAPSLEMWVNEDFIAQNLPLNVLGSVFYKVNFDKDMPILGNIIFTGGVDPEGYTIGLNSREIEYLFDRSKQVEPLRLGWEQHKKDNGFTE